jgi:hypothetical protein
MFFLNIQNNSKKIQEQNIPGRQIRLSDPIGKTIGFYRIRWEFVGICRNPWHRIPIGSYGAVSTWDQLTYK